MTFHSKIERTFKGILCICTVLFAAFTILPIFSSQTDFVTVTILVIIFILIEGFLFWTVFDIKYVLYDEYLYVRGGPLRSKIKYRDMTKVKKSYNTLVGYRVISSSNTVEISYTSGFRGQIIISPEDRDLFIEELKKRSPQL